MAGTNSGNLLICVAMNLPFVVWILRSFIGQAAQSLEEEARADRAGAFLGFCKVLPLINPGLALAAIFTLLASRQIITGMTAGAVKG